MSTYTFKWPSGPSEVTVTGSFDNWSKSFPLVKQTDGSFELSVPFDKTDKIIYKYVVDDKWVTSPDSKVEADEGGNENNVVYPEDFVSASSTESKIPEAGGLAAVAGAVGLGGVVAAVTGKSAEEPKVEEPKVEEPKAVEEPKEDLKTTVLPSEENKQTTLGEPGIVIPQDAEKIEAFKQVNTLDPKVLNQEAEESATKEAEVTTTAAPVVPENAEDIKEFKEVSDVDPKTLNVEESESIPASAGSKKVKKVTKLVKKASTEDAAATSAPTTAATDDTVTEKTPAAAPVKAAKPEKKVEVKAEKKKGFFSKLKKALK